MIGYPIQYTGTLFAIGVVLILLAQHQHMMIFRLILGWAGVTFIAVACAYLTGSTRLFMKRPSGKRNPLSWFLLWPFDLLNACLFNVYHRISGEPAYAEVLPGLYLGRRLWNRESIKLGPCSVLDLTCELNENRIMRACEGYHCLPVLDNTCPSQEQLREAVDWLSQALKGGNVYVHCAAGHGRSATVVVAYMLASSQAKTVDDAVVFLKSKRKGVHLNSCQRAAVERFMTAQGDRLPNRLHEGSLKT